MLVTVVVITYNSAKYVIETLDSIAAQDYPELELVVTDDCSPGDNTFELCQQWVDAHKNRFVRAVVVQTPKNMGISGNCNNGLRQVTGEWVKFIAGDDMLMPDCISSFVKVAKEGKDKLYVCGLLPFSENKEFSPSIVSKRFGLLSAREQERFVFETMYGTAPFFETATLRSIGFNEKYPMVEDFPILCEFLKRGYHIGRLEKYLVRYRQYGESVCHGNQRFKADIFNAKYDYLISGYHRQGMYLYEYHYRVEKYVRRTLQKKTILNFLKCSLLRMIDVIYIAKKIGFIHPPKVRDVK